jgi:hypothetical protein
MKEKRNRVAASDRNLIWGSIPAIIWRDWRTLLETLFRVFSPKFEAGTSRIQNRSSIPGRVRGQMLSSAERPGRPLTRQSDTLRTPGPLSTIVKRPVCEADRTLTQTNNSWSSTCIPSHTFISRCLPLQRLKLNGIVFKDSVRTAQ